MTSGQHRGQPKRGGPNLAVIGFGLIAVTCGLAIGIAGVAELMRYSPYEDPGALGTGYTLAGTGLALVLTPLATLGLGTAARLIRRYRTWKAGLGPAQRAWLTGAEIAALYGIAIAWHEHNKHESARLTASVMGPEREG